MRIGDRHINTQGVEMKLVIGLVFIGVLFFMNGCSDQGFRGKVDNRPYVTKECRKSLSRGTEIVHSAKIDKIVVYKKKRRLFTYRKGLKVDEFRISMGKNCNKGDKVCSGDYKTPEGSYRIVRKKCDSRLYKSLMISYPDAKDRAEARAKGLKPGGYITIHGQPKWNDDGKGDNYTLSRDWTEGCIAVSNVAIDRLWRSVQNGTKIDIHP